MRPGNGWGTEKLNMIHFWESLAVNCLPNFPAILGELLGIREREVVAIAFSQKEPIATPGNISADLPDAGNFKCKRTLRPPTRHIIHGHFTALVKCRGHD